MFIWFIINFMRIRQIGETVAEAHAEMRRLMDGEH